jgi:tripartite-type tricarboxylate transporter receptor subunit TctC
MERFKGIRKGQIVSFRPEKGLLRRDAEVIKTWHEKGLGKVVEISLLVTPNEISRTRSAFWRARMKKVM